MPEPDQSAQITKCQLLKYYKNDDYHGTLKCRKTLFSTSRKSGVLKWLNNIIVKKLRGRANLEVNIHKFVKINGKQREIFFK